MKEYLKPEIEVVNFASEAIAEVEMEPASGNGKEEW